MASARGANSAADGYTRFNDDIGNIEASYQSNNINISKLIQCVIISGILLVFRHIF
jgi:hypothetical protein